MLIHILSLSCYYESNLKYALKFHEVTLCFEVKVQDLFAFFIFTHSLFDSIVLQIAG